MKHIDVFRHRVSEVQCIPGALPKDQLCARVRTYVALRALAG